MSERSYVERKLSKYAQEDGRRRNVCAGWNRDNNNYIQFFIQ